MTVDMLESMHDSTSSIPEWSILKLENILSNNLLQQNYVYFLNVANTRKGFQNQST